MNLFVQSTETMMQNRDRCRTLLKRVIKSMLGESKADVYA